MENNKIPDILTQASKERFRRRVMMGSRLIAIALILAIFWIGYIQLSYAKEFNEMKSKHGSNAFCYYCGLESGRSCSCNYLEPGQKVTGEYLETIAGANILPCENRNNKNPLIDFDNLEVNN